MSVQMSNAADDPLRVVVEPWGMEFMLPSRSFCEIVSVGGEAPAVIDAEISEHGYIFWIETRGAIYEYRQDGELID